jgi:serine/threonine-protein kinase
VIAKRFVQTPLDVAALREGVPRPVARAVQQALARVAVDRQETAAQFVVALNEVDAAPTKSAAPARSLAILPFENLSADPDNQYFADGIADDILDALVQIDGLQVAARNSAFSFRGKQTALTEIGAALNVATVLQGSVRRAGSRLRMAVQLVSVADGYHLWSERFDRELVDVFAVQDEIAAAIAAKLQVTFVPPAEPAGKATTAELEAFELVAKGRALLALRGASLLEARACLERAIELDPQNADAFAVLGETLVSFVRYSLMPVGEGRPLAKAALTRALELAPESATVMGVLGNVSLLLDHDPDAAFVWWERALALQPRLAEVRVVYAINGLILLRQDDARGIAELARAVQDDPRSVWCACHHANGLAATGRPVDAIAEIERACALAPTAFLPLYLRVMVRSWGSDADGALAAVKRASAVIGRSPWVLGLVPRAYVQRGEQALAEAVYVELQARAQTEEVSRFILAFAADALGRTDDAIAYAIESVQRCDNAGPYWTRAPFFSAAFHAHPRYPELLREIGL